jgi:CHAD domain-containing protein
MKVALRGHDPEGVHQVRVAARRLRVWLQLGGHRALTDDLKYLCRALSLARDLELIAHQPALRPYHRAQRRLAQATVVQTLRSARTRGLLEALANLPTPHLREARARLPRFERQVRASLQRLRQTPSLGALHRLRRNVRTLRFAREWLGLDTRPYQRAQDGLGQLCDLLALERLLTAWALETGQPLELVAPIERALTEALGAP